jgi:apolipoprotein N-acyltransferase
VVAVQPNVPMSPVKTASEIQELIDRHLTISTNGLQVFGEDNLPRLVIWPESPMNFTYSSDRSLQDLIGKFVKENHTSLLLNSLEPAPNNGGYNSAVMVNEDGRAIAQYDKIRLMPFGEYVPLPHWLGGSLISGIVGDFTAGDKYSLVPVADHRAGVFICIESAYPSVARNLSREGADVLINISNDGYLGPTAVMRQHLANAIFRAVENGRPLLRVTNTGISAAISPEGMVHGATPGFVASGRAWTVDDYGNRTTFYTRFGDLFVGFCAAVTLITFISTFLKRRRSLRAT